MELITAIIAGGIIGLVVLGVGWFALKQFLSKEYAQRQIDTQHLMASVSQQALKDAQEQLLSMAHEKLGNETTNARRELDHKQEVISGMIGQIRQELVRNQEYLKSNSEHQAASFAAITKELEAYKIITKELRGSTEDLKKVLSNNQMRGAFGEQVAENLLRMAGFVIGQDYVFNKMQEHSETRPDFTLFLPDKTRVNIDAKFPYAALVKASSTEDAQEREMHLKQFASDVRQKIKQVTSRDYINPEEKTVDFVILFIPNEMIFSFIYDQLNDVWEEAMNKKVILAGPFSFTALLRMIKQAHTNFRYQENIHQVVGMIQKFEQEYEKYDTEFVKIGDRIESLSKQYSEVATTRSKKLGKLFDQIKNQQLSEPGEVKVSILE